MILPNVFLAASNYCRGGEGRRERGEGRREIYNLARSLSAAKNVN
jgi:hypothetical protein